MQLKHCVFIEGKNMKRHRRYREKWNLNSISVASTHGERIHDFIKGWGTIAKDGKSVLWDSYRPPTKKQRDKLDRHWKKNPSSKFTFPIINKIMSDVSISDIISVQPMYTPDKDA